MPRDISGTYTLPLAPIEPRRIPVVNWVNPTVEDIEAALNNIPGQAIADGSISQAKLGGLLASSTPTSLQVGRNNTTATGVEIGGQAGVATTAFIDFHSGAVATDYDGRIRCDGGTGVAGGGHMAIDATPLELLKGQLKFPGTQNPSADPNTLDDYEEGTWTPTLEFVTPGNASIVYSQRFGKYTKIGDVVHVQAWINTSTFTHTTASGFLSITGLPFPVGNSNGLFAALGTYGRGFIWEPTYFHSFAALATGSSIAMYLVGGGLGGSTTATRISEARHTSGANVEIIVGGTYKV